MNISFSLPLVGYQTRCSSWKVHAAQTTGARLPQSTLVLVRRRLAHDRATQGSISPLHRVAFFKRRHPHAPCALMKLATCYRIPVWHPPAARNANLCLWAVSTTTTHTLAPTSCVAVPYHLPCSSQKPETIGFRGLMPCAQRGAG